MSYQEKLEQDLMREIKQREIETKRGEEFNSKMQKVINRLLIFMISLIIITSVIEEYYA